jgi:hypothetical protein
LKLQRQGKLELSSQQPGRQLHQRTDLAILLSFGMGGDQRTKALVLPASSHHYTCGNFDLHQLWLWHQAESGVMPMQGRLSLA